jgi:hypothetical protein
MLQIVGPSLEEVRPAATTAIMSGQQGYAHKDILAMTLHFLGHKTTFYNMKYVFGRPDSSIAKLVRLGLTALYKTML